MNASAYTTANMNANVLEKLGVALILIAGVKIIAAVIVMVVEMGPIAVMVVVLAGAVIVAHLSLVDF